LVTSQCLAYRVLFVNRSEYKTRSCELQDLRQGERYSASRVGQSLEERELRGSIPLEFGSGATLDGLFTSYGQRLVSGIRIDDLADPTAQGIWKAHLKDELAPGYVVDDVAVRAAGVLAERGYWMRMFQATTEDLTSWIDLHGDYWVVSLYNGCIWD
jgi:hypothetical protein